MKNTAVTGVAERLKRLPRCHRIAHLRALIGLQPVGYGRRDYPNCYATRYRAHQANRYSGRNRIPQFSRSPSDAKSQTPKAVQSRQGT
jgi:hypothetical protein